MTTPAATSLAALEGPGAWELTMRQTWDVRVENLPGRRFPLDGHLILRLRTNADGAVTHMHARTVDLEGLLWHESYYDGTDDPGVTTIRYWEKRCSVERMPVTESVSALEQISTQIGVLNPPPGSEGENGSLAWQEELGPVSLVITQRGGDLGTRTVEYVDRDTGELNYTFRDISIQEIQPSQWGAHIQADTVFHRACPNPEQPPGRT